MPEFRTFSDMFGDDIDIRPGKLYRAQPAEDKRREDSKRDRRKKAWQRQRRTARAAKSSYLDSAA
jgi:oligoendopeptidase F